MSKCSNVYQPYRKKGFLSLSIYFSKKNAPLVQEFGSCVLLTITKLSAHGYNNSVSIYIITFEYNILKIDRASKSETTFLARCALRQCYHLHS